MRVHLEKKIDLDRLSTQYCSEPYEYSAKKVVHMIPDIVAEMRALREIAEAAMRFHMGHVHLKKLSESILSDRGY